MPLPSLIFIAFLTGASEKDCQHPLRDTSYRHLPRDGSAKDGIVDYKLINQLLMSLRRSVRNGDPLPPGFEAQIVAPRWTEAPVGGVRLTGPLQPPHKLAGQVVKIEIQRFGLALVVTVSADGVTFERDISHEDYSKIFPFMPPSGQGGLLSLVRGVQDDQEMGGWLAHFL